MYDLLKEWSELEQLKQNKWVIDSFYNNERNTYQFTFKLLDLDEQEIYSIDVNFRQLHSTWYCAVSIDTFFASNYSDYLIGMEVLEIIRKKASEIDCIMDEQDIIEQAGRC